MEREATGTPRTDTTEPHRTWYQLSESNAQLTRRVHDLEEDNADLREKLSWAMAELKQAQSSIKMMEQSLMDGEALMRTNGIEL